MQEAVLYVHPSQYLYHKWAIIVDIVFKGASKYLSTLAGHGNYTYIALENVPKETHRNVTVGL